MDHDASRSTTVRHHLKVIAADFPDVPRRYCDNHFLSDLAKPVLEADGHPKVRMRK